MKIKREIAMVNSVPLRMWAFSRFRNLYAFASSWLSRLRWVTAARRAAKFANAQVNDGWELVDLHYHTWVRRDVASRRRGFELALGKLGGKPATIVETGTSAWGVDSTRLFDAYVRIFGGQFQSVDLREEPSRRLAGQVSSRTKFSVGDSVEALRNLPDTFDQVDLVYLDSLDVDWSFPGPSASHCLQEWMAVAPHLRSGSLVLIDDTPKTLEDIPNFDPNVKRAAERHLLGTGRLPGKGELVLLALNQVPRAQIIHHRYSLLLEIV